MGILVRRNSEKETPVFLNMQKMYWKNLWSWKGNTVNKMNLNKNEAVAVGTVVKDLEYSHETHGEKFYSLKISSTRMSGKEDIIPVVVSERILNTSRKYEGKLLGIRGQFRSFNQW